MKPIEAFLASVHPEVMTRGKTLLNGTEVEFGQPNNKLLKKLVKEHYAAGQEALEDFRKWLVRKESKKNIVAARITATVWNVLCMTYDMEKEDSNPLDLIDKRDETYSYGTKIQIAHALRLWARYKRNSALYERLLAWMRHSQNTPKYILDAFTESPPYTRKEYRKVLKALEEFKGSPRYPWAWPCLRIVFICGIALTEILYLERAKVIKALGEGHITLRMRSSNYSRIISTSLIEEPLRVLAAFPLQWVIVGDLVSPGRNEDGHCITLTPLTKVIKKIFARAKVEYTSNCTHRMRWSAAWQYYEKTKNLVGTSQILGMRDLHRVSTFIEELKRRSSKPVEEEVVIENESDEL
jgi:hypothetical protein